MKDSNKRKRKTTSSESVSKKKSKNQLEEESDGSQDEYDAETKKDVQEVLEKQEFPIKRVSSKKKKKVKKEDDEDNDEQKEVAKDAAIEYLNLWKDNRDEWKFKKVRQTWLLQNMYEKEKVSKADFASLLEYLEDLKGLSRKITLEQARKIVEDDEDVGKRKLKRATKVLRLLCDP